jgi:starch-binding outer membrane protein, SusD/RagB family
MKKIATYILIPAFLIGLLGSCHKIDVPITTELTPNVFPQNDVQYVQAMGPVYTALRHDFAISYWFEQSLSSDEAIMPARGGNWYDNQNYRMLHYHDWNRDHGFTGSSWAYLSRLIGTSNQAMSILRQTMPEGASKNANLSELKVVRALGYFMMMDLFGNLPLDTLFGDFKPRANVPRAEVFNFIESEVKAALPFLNPAAGVTTYGRANKYTAFALLAKMYVNAEYYTGTARYNDCIIACDSIIQSGRYAIEPRSSYLRMFYPNNGPQMKEFIFTIPYDPTALPAPGTNGMMYRARYDVPRSMRAKYSLPYTPEGPESTLPEFYAHFNDPGDVRNGMWLTGLQYNHAGQPIIVNTTKKGYDFSYTGSDGTAPYAYHVNLTPNIVLRLNAATFDVGNDEIGWNMGYRCNKFYPDSTSISRNQNNDMPIFRYSDILLMKAESILRGGTATMGHTALSLANMLRAERSTSGALASVNLDYIYSERSREFVHETWHRNDMIRFGKYEGAWGFKTNSETYRRIFPIPTNAFVLNPMLVQNPGYQ